jgi:hypothetical protein
LSVNVRTEKTETKESRTNKTDKNVAGAFPNKVVTFVAEEN